MKLYIKERVFSWNDQFTVKDENGWDKYFVEGEFFSFGKKLHLLDIHGREVALIRQQLLTLMQQEYEKGNYVIAGGDFNQSFPGTLEQFPIQDPTKWLPGVLAEDDLPDGWQFAFDSATATCRLLDQP